MLARLYLLDIGVHRAVQVAGVFHDAAAQGFALLFGLVQLCIGLTHLGVDQATAVDRDVQLQAHGRLLDVAAVGLAQGNRIAEAQRIVVAFLVLGDRVKRWQVPGPALLDGLLGGADGIVAGQQIEVLPARGFDPGLGVVRYWRQDRQVMPDAPDRVVLTVGQGNQCFKGVVHLALRNDAVGASGVVAGL
ncbi:hypothetical protein D3C80_714280 [compost metagenome]